MSDSNPKDVLQDELMKAKLDEIKEAVTWHLTDIITTSGNIQQLCLHAQDTYKNKVNLQRTAANLRDVSSKLQEIEQYLSQ